MTVTGTEALEAMLSHHRALEDELASRTAAVARAVAAGRDADMALGNLVAFLTSDVLAHAEAEERTLYPAAARGELADVVSQMVAEHRHLATAVERLAGAPADQTAARASNEIAALFARHVAKENEVLLPALARRGDVDLGFVLAEMRHSLPESAQAPSAGDPEAERSGGDAADLDVREIPPARRHEAIFAAYHALAPGAGFVLINDHDPKPLRRQFEAEHAGEFTWDYREAGPELWRVRIGRATTAF